MVKALTQAGRLAVTSDHWLVVVLNVHSVAVKPQVPVAIDVEYFGLIVIAAAPI